MVQDTLSRYTMIAAVGLILCPALPHTMTFIETLLGYAERLRSAPGEDPPFDTLRPLLQYDFVVVGAGAGGAAVAARLAEVANWTVLLLEAGGDETFISDVPLMASYLANSAMDWSLKAEPAPGFCKALEGGRCRWHIGKVLGGTTVLNYMVYNRGSPHDYDAWEALGNVGWGWKDVLPYFLRSEGARPPDLARSPFHGTEGPVTVEYAGWKSAVGPAVLEAAREAGHPIRDPHVPGHQLGFSYVQATLRRGSRCSASKAYLRPSRLRGNLHVAKRAEATRVLIAAGAEGQRPRAVGVRFRRGGGREAEARVRREVVVAAGAVGSPKLLMLSGIGPAEHLADLGIPLVKDLRVGDNLQDHVALGGLTFSVRDPITVIERRMVTNLTMGLDYLLRGAGPLTLPGGAEVIGFLRFPDNASLPEPGDEADRLRRLAPDAEVVFGPGALTGDSNGSLRRALSLRADYARRLLRALRGRDAFAAVPILLRPRSRGRVRLRSADPRSPPLLYPNYLRDPYDARALALGAREAVRLSQMPALQRLGSKLNPVPYPGCEALSLDSDEYWECAVRHFTVSMQHQVGTCKMGPATDPTAVVDPQLRVHGVDGLRVADASVMPLIPAGHTQAPAYMVGEKAADLVKQAWGHTI